MVSVTGVTAAKAQDIEDASVVTGHIDVTTGHLLLTTGDGTVIDAGIARPDAAISAAVLVETNARIAAVNSEASTRATNDTSEANARAAAVAAITLTTPLQLADGNNFTFSNPTISATSGGVSSLEGTIVVPPSGRIKITVGATLRTSVGGGPGNSAFIGYELRQTNVSGTTLLATDIQRAAMNENANHVQSSSSHLLSGLTPGSVVFCRMMHWAENGTTGACRIRRLLVEAMP